MPVLGGLGKEVNHGGHKISDLDHKFYERSLTSALLSLQNLS
jgi:hypothetical protein